MIEKISTMDVRERLGDILNRVALRQDAFIIERKGKPLAAMVPVEKLHRIEQLARMTLGDALHRRAGASSPTQADRLADRAKHRTRPRRPR